MIDWNIVEEHFKQHLFYNLSNNKSKTIVMFGNCHFLPLAFFLNINLNYQYNIIVILSWFYEKTFTDEKIEEINGKINKYLQDSSYFIYQNHYKNYKVNADKIISSLPISCTKINIPNLMLDCFDFNQNNNFKDEKKKYIDSQNKLYKSIFKSDFPNLMFIHDNLFKIRFFNTKYHPTHYILFLLSKNLYYRIENIDEDINLNHYYNIDLRNEFMNIDFSEFINLPGKWELKELDYKITNFLPIQDYYDINFLQS